MAELGGDDPARRVAGLAPAAEMGFLIDTNVLFAAKRGDAVAARWLREVPPERCYFSVITIGAIMRELPDLEDWVGQLSGSYAQRILPVDAEVAMQWGRLDAKRGRSAEDALIGATAAVHNLALVTRNVEVFFDAGVTVINPFR